MLHVIALPRLSAAGIPLLNPCSANVDRIDCLFVVRNELTNQWGRESSLSCLRGVLRDPPRRSAASICTVVVQYVTIGAMVEDGRHGSRLSTATAQLGTSVSQSNCASRYDDMGVSRGIPVLLGSVEEPRERHHADGHCHVLLVRV